MTDAIQFDAAFRALTDHDPFPWQRQLYEQLVQGNVPRSCDIPTGLGKTAVVAVWLIALAKYPEKMPRRLVYVVNRRTVVDQTTNEAMKLRDNAAKIGIDNFAISMLRGQFADNQEWSADPSRPAVICGTVDMIGSRLLFGGYRIGFRSRPLHAGFLGQDALLVHDEAHLEPAFQRLLERIALEQDKAERTGELPWPKLRVMALSATARSDNRQVDNVLLLDKEDYKHPIVQSRIEAKKALHLHPCNDEKKALVAHVVERALEHKESGDAILVFVRGVDDALNVLGQLEQARRDHVAPLTGTMRGYERDQLVRSNPVFARFMAASDRPKGLTPTEGTVYLVCTSAGEVGINLSADHLVCDLSTFDSMAQRLGRVNRFGDRRDTRVDVVYPESFDDKKPNPQRRATLDLLMSLPPIDEGSFDASPKALGELKDRPDLPCRIVDAFSPTPTILDATDILFDAWALTTIRDKMPGRPPVAPYLHGVAEWEPPETHVAWREEVGIITDDLFDRHQREDLLEDYPLKPHELLRDRSDRVLDKLQALAGRHANAPVWVVEGQGKVTTWLLAKLADPSATKPLARKPLIARIEGCTVLLPPIVGGLSRGMLDGAFPHADDVADIEVPATEQRIRLWSDDEEYNEKTAGMRLVQSIDPNRDDVDDDDDEVRRTWDWYKRKGTHTAPKPVEFRIHVGDVECHIDRILKGLSLPEEIAQAVRVAVKLHDHGKRRPQFQFTLGNRAYPGLVLAKSGRTGAKLPETYRHEFGSMVDAVEDPEFQQLSPEIQDVVLHLIAAHHGRARPHFPMDEAFDPEPKGRDITTIATEVPRRFARLQRKYGRWGLAYLESLVRAADWAASAEPSQFVTETKAVSQ